MVVIKDAATCSPTACVSGRGPYVCLRLPGVLCFLCFLCIHTHTHTHILLPSARVWTCGTLFQICACHTHHSPLNVARATRWRAAIWWFGIGFLTLPREGTIQDWGTFPTVESVSLFESQKSVLCSGLWGEGMGRDRVVSVVRELISLWHSEF